jgi:hypothetical protein
MSPDLDFSSAKWDRRKNRLPKMPNDAFSVGARYRDLRESCGDRSSRFLGFLRRLNFGQVGQAM